MNDYGIRIRTAEDFKAQVTLNHPFYPKDISFFILKKGRMVYERQVETIEVEAPLLGFIDKKAVFEFTYLSDDLEVYIISFTQAFTNRLSLKTNSLQSYTYFKAYAGQNMVLTPAQLDELDAFAHLFERILAHGDQNPNTKNILGSVFSGIIQLIAGYDSISKAIHEKISRAELITLQFLRNVEVYFRNEQDVRFYAEKQFITVRHLTVTLKNVTGKTARQIISEFLIKEAKAILIDSDKTIYQIAHELGFSDGYTFSHFFKKNTSTNPTDYRKNYFSTLG